MVWLSRARTSSGVKSFRYTGDLPCQLLQAWMRDHLEAPRWACGEPGAKKGGQGCSWPFTIREGLSVGSEIRKGTHLLDRTIISETGGASVLRFPPGALGGEGRLRGTVLRSEPRVWMLGGPPLAGLGAALATEAAGWRGVSAVWRRPSSSRVKTGLEDAQCRRAGWAKGESLRRCTPEDPGWTALGDHCRPTAGSIRCRLVREAFLRGLEGNRRRPTCFSTQNNTFHHPVIVRPDSSAAFNLVPLGTSPLGLATFDP